MDKVLVANFKMNFKQQDILTYLDSIEGKVPKPDVIFCPTSLYSHFFLERGYEVGLQNVASHEKGSYTGEIAAMQASSIGIKYVLLGHSERRYYHHESVDEIREKIKCALKEKLHIILCIGENEEERRRGETISVLEKQVRQYLSCFTKEETASMWIAYEPVWAIGSGETPKENEISLIVEKIKKTVFGINQHEDIPVLYGGSVDLKICTSFASIPHLKGFLVGSASLDTKALLDMIKVAVTM